METMVEKIFFLIFVAIWIALTIKLIQLMVIVSKRDREYIEMKMKKELKPCPFCGGKAVYHEGWQREDGEFIKGKVVCEKCGCYKSSQSLADYTGTIYHGFVGKEVAQKVSETAIEAWNTRV